MQFPKHGIGFSDKEIILMGFFIAAGVIAFIAFTLFIIGFSLGRQGSSFEKNKN